MKIETLTIAFLGLSRTMVQLPCPPAITPCAVTQLVQILRRGKLGAILDQKMGKEYLNIEMLLRYWTATPTLDWGPRGLWKCSFVSEVQSFTLRNTGYLKIRQPH